MGWLKIQKLEHLENKKKIFCEKKILNLCFRWHILRSYRFVADVTFKQIPVSFKIYADFECNLKSVKSCEVSFSKKYHWLRSL